MKIIIGNATQFSCISGKSINFIGDQNQLYSRTHLENHLQPPLNYSKMPRHPASVTQE